MIHLDNVSVEFRLKAERVQAADGDDGPGGRADRQRRVLGVPLAQRGEEVGHVRRSDLV